jgi:acyl carrier protein
MTQAEAIRWVAGIFSEPVEKLSPETSRTSILDWDSLGMLTLISSLDSDFAIVLPDNEIQNLKTVGDILDVLRRHGILDS